MPPGLFSFQPFTLPVLERAFAHHTLLCSTFFQTFPPVYDFHPKPVSLVQCLGAFQLPFPSKLHGQTNYVCPTLFSHHLWNISFPQLWKTLSSSSQ